MDNIDQGNRRLRFEVTEEMHECVRVLTLVDKETGVNYLVVDKEGFYDHAMSITPRLTRSGKLFISE